MFKEMIFLASSAFADGSFISQLLSKWEQIGFFSYLLPFLIIFALVFGILTKMNLFKDNRMVNGVIALSVALMALQFDFVPTFFSEIFPRLGVGLAIILGILIVMGFFMDPKSSAMNYILLAVSVVVMYFVLVNAAGATGWTTGDFWQNHWGEILAGVLLVVFVIAMINSGKPEDKNKPPFIGHAFKQDKD